MTKIPNLELLEYQAKQIISADELTLAKIKKHYKNFECFKNRVPIDLTCDVFVQTWFSTATAFDVTEDGKPTFGGQMLTQAYTVVFKEEISETYIVFIDNKLCYKLSNPSKLFFEDLKDRKLLSLSKAKVQY